MFVVMFVSMVFIHLFILPWTMIANISDFRISLTQVYAAFFMGACMVVVEAFMHPMSLHGLCAVVMILVWSVLCLRYQLGVSDTEYLHDMIPHHSMALLTSRPRIWKTENPVIRELAIGIVNTQEREIAAMKALAAY